MPYPTENFRLKAGILSPTSVDYLPMTLITDVLMASLNYLSTEEVLATRRVSKGWREIAYDVVQVRLQCEEELYPSDLLNYRKVLGLTYAQMLSAPKRLKVIRAHELDGQTLSCVLRALGTVKREVEYLDVSGMPKTNHRRLTLEDVRKMEAFRIRRLRLNECRVTTGRLGDIAKLTGVRSLTLSKNVIYGLTPLAPLKQLTELDVSYNRELTNADVTSGFKNLQALYLMKTGLSAVPDFKTHTALRKLYLGQNWRLASLEGLRGNTTLEELNIDQTDVYDLTPLRFTPLCSLMARETRIDEFSGLAGLTNLTRLDLENTRIRRLSILAHLPLKRLSLTSTNDLVEFDHLRHLTRLEFVDLSNTNMAVTGPLSLCPRLRKVFLNFTRIRNIVFFTLHPTLTHLGFRDTFVTRRQVRNYHQARERAGLPSVALLV